MDDISSNTTPDSDRDLIQLLGLTDDEYTQLAKMAEDFDVTLAEFIAQRLRELLP